MSFQDGSIHDMSPLTITKPGVCPRPKPQAVDEYMMQLCEQMSTGNRCRPTH